MGGDEFNIFYGCAARCVHFFTPPLRRKRASQRMPTEINKTGAITKVKVLVEQMGRHLKIFRITFNAISISFFILMLIIF